MKKWVIAHINELKKWSKGRIATEIVGWIGTALILIAHFLVSEGKLTGESVEYHLINLFGAIFMGIQLFYRRIWPPLTLQIIWGIISINVLMKIL